MKLLSRFNKRQLEQKKVEKREPKKKIRECLTCGKKFKSEWVGNRICDKCKYNHSATRDFITPQKLEIPRHGVKHGAAV